MLFVLTNEVPEVGLRMKVFGINKKSQKEMKGMLPFPCIHKRKERLFVDKDLPVFDEVLT